MLRWMRRVLYRPWQRVAGAVALLGLYWVASVVVAAAAGPMLDLRPLPQQGHTGGALLGAVVMFAGCMHGAKYTRSRWLIAAFGLLEGWLQGAIYGDQMGHALLDGTVTQRAAEMGLAAVVAGCVVLTYAGAWIVWATSEH